MLANGWKTQEEIMKDYGYSEPTFNARMQECFASKYRDAIIYDKSKYGLIDEPRYQEFLKWRTKEKWDKLLGRSRR